MPDTRIQLNCGGGNFKKQFKKADKSGADIALVFGEQEIIENKVTIKPLRSSEEQTTIEQAQLVDYLNKAL